MKKNVNAIILHPRASKKTLNDYVFFQETLIRPLDEVRQNHELFTGIILKLPINHNEGSFPGDEWKNLIEKEQALRVGDKVIYCSKATIVIDREPLHLVSWIIGKILNK